MQYLGLSDKVLSKLTDTQLSVEIEKFTDELNNRVRDKNAEEGLYENEVCLTYRSQLYKLKYKLSRNTPMKDLHETQRKRQLNVNTKNPGV